MCTYWLSFTLVLFLHFSRCGYPKTKEQNVHICGEYANLRQRMQKLYKYLSHDYMYTCSICEEASQVCSLRE